MDNPMPASWQGQITQEWPSDEPANEHYIDEDDAISIQKAIVVCMERDNRVAMILTHHYYHRTGFTTHLVGYARNRFWRYLYF
jgi:hypothetical protein